MIQTGVNNTSPIFQFPALISSTRFATSQSSSPQYSHSVNPRSTISNRNFFHSRSSFRLLLSNKPLWVRLSQHPVSTGIGLVFHRERDDNAQTVAQLLIQFTSNWYLSCRRSSILDRPNPRSDWARSRSQIRHQQKRMTILLNLHSTPAAIVPSSKPRIRFPGVTIPVARLSPHPHLPHRTPLHTSSNQVGAKVPRSSFVDYSVLAWHLHERSAIYYSYLK